MKKMNQFIKATSLLCILVFCSQAQITSTTSSGSSNQKPQEVVEQARVNQIISESERYFKQGELNIKDGRLPQAWTDLDKSVEVILLSNAKSNSKLSDYYFQLIDQIYQLEMTVKKKTIQKGNLSFTVSPKCLNKKQDDKDTTGLLLKALNLYKRGNYDESLMNLRVVLINEPMSSIAYLLLGKIHLRNGDIEQAVSSLKTALFWDNRLIEAHILLGKIYLERNDRLQSQNYSRSALAIEPNNKRAQALARIVENNYTNEDKKNIENDKLEVEDLLQKASQEKITDVKSSVESVFVAPFQSSENYDLLGEDFAYVLSEVLTAPNLCVVSNEDREKILENFGFDTDETFTLATAIKSAIVSKSSLLIVGQYERTSNNITATTKLIRVNEGRFLKRRTSRRQKDYPGRYTERFIVKSSYFARSNCLSDTLPIR